MTYSSLVRGIAMAEGFIPPHGGYKELRSCRKAEIVFDATVCFCKRFMNTRDRTVDQMIQAARSGKQNIIEGTMASGTSKEMEVKLIGVARASLEELLADYLDFLRTNNLSLWPKDSKAALAVRRLAYRRKARDGAELGGKVPQESYETYRNYIEERSPETVANITICLIHQANYLLDQQLRSLEQAFVKQGGLREAMTRARLRERNRQPENPE